MESAGLKSESVRGRDVIERLADLAQARHGQA